MLDRYAASTSVLALAFSPNGKWLASAGSDGAVRLWEVATQEEVLALRGHVDKAIYVAFSQDGRSLLSSGEDAQVFWWGLRPRPAPGAKPALDTLWQGLRSARAADAYRALWMMSESPTAPAFLRKKILPAKPVASARLAKLIVGLGSDQFAVREAASKELAKLGEQAGPAMHKALEARPDVEVQQRLRRLLDALEKGPSSAELRQIRAIQALELATTAQAREALRGWASGAPEARLTKEAKAALQRLDQHR
jgi:hypothetical protein